MSAVARPPVPNWQDLQVVPMTVSDLPEVMAIERAIYPFPWTEGNFSDSLKAGYEAWMMRLDGVTVGYAVVMNGPDEAHLLNLSVTAARQGAGVGAAMLEWLMRHARSCGRHAMLLEVRPSNARALRLYQRSDFKRVGLRRRYYPSFEDTRENAIVMRRLLGDLL